MVLRIAVGDVKILPEELADEAELECEGDRERIEDEGEKSVSNSAGTGCIETECLLASIAFLVLGEALCEADLVREPLDLFMVSGCVDAVTREELLEDPLDTDRIEDRLDRLFTFALPLVGDEARESSSLRYRSLSSAFSAIISFR